MERDIIRIILQYLHSHGYRLLCGVRCSYTTSAMVLQEESGMVTRDTSNRTPIIQSIKTKIIAGDWEESESVLKEQCSDKCFFHSPLTRRQFRFLSYLLYKQIFLELISRNEHQKALHYLFKYIKPLEEVCEQHFPGEFKELCYLLSVKVVSFAPLNGRASTTVPTSSTGRECSALARSSQIRSRTPSSTSRSSWRSQ